MAQNKQTIFDNVEKMLVAKGFDIVSKDQDRPWGGFFVINENQAQDFANHYFDGINAEELKIGGKLSPKILVVAPNSRLSWQYHYRRAEIWQIIDGKVAVKRSFDDTEGDLKEYNTNDQIKLEKEERHRLIGLEDWGLVAEIWQHTDAANPSNEDDIVRVQDDFGR